MGSGNHLKYNSNKDQLDVTLNALALQAEEMRLLQDRLDVTLEEMRLLQNRLDVTLNAFALQTEEIQSLKDEIAHLKKQKARPKIDPSILEGAKSKDKQANKNKITRGKHPRRKKKNNLKVHSRQRIKPNLIPEGAAFKGCKKFTVQDLLIQTYTTVYELERWRLPDGTYVNGQLPENVHGHYGAQVMSYILYQYYGCRVTEHLLLAQLKEFGILISAGQLSNILTKNNEAFHGEKNELLQAGIRSTEQIKVDDTGARHQGKNGYSTIIGNEHFTYIVSTDSKSRINFLEILHGATPSYIVNEDALDYIETFSKTKNWLGYLLTHSQGQSMDREQWEKFLEKHNIKSKTDTRLATEATLYAALITKGIPKNLGVHADGAGQFTVFVRSLCWIHEERHYRKLIPYNESMRTEIEEVRGEIWELYNGLKEYQATPSESLREILDEQFEVLFLKKTKSPTLNKRLAATYEKKQFLLRVLERPETPLHNNGTETDAREMVVKRKISGGTRSEEGRKSRDTFVSLKKTCVKQGINFFLYVYDRFAKTFEIPRLSQLILAHSSRQPSGP